MNNILVGNLMPNITEQNLRPLFEKHGTVRRFENDDRSLDRSVPRFCIHSDEGRWGSGGRNQRSQRHGFERQDLEGEAGSCTTASYKAVRAAVTPGTDGRLHLS